jgi:hypothetical protein
MVGPAKHSSATLLWLLARSRQQHLRLQYALLLYGVGYRPVLMPRSNRRAGVSRRSSVGGAAGAAGWGCRCRR